MTTLRNAEKLAPISMLASPQGTTHEIKDSFWEATKVFIKKSLISFAIFCTIDRLLIATNKPKVAEWAMGLREAAFFSSIVGVFDGVHKFNDTNLNNDRAAVLNKHKDTPLVQTLVQTEIDLRTSYPNKFSAPLSTTDKIFGSAALAGLAGACAAEAFIPKLKLSKTLINTCVGSIGLGGIGYIGSRIHSTSQALQAEREKLSNAEKIALARHSNTTSHAPSP